MSGLCPVCPMDVEGPHFADRQRRPLTNVEARAASVPPALDVKRLASIAEDYFPAPRTVTDWRKCLGHIVHAYAAAETPEPEASEG